MTNARRIKNLRIITKISLAFLVLAISATVRFIEIKINPGWYSDEGTLVLLGQSMARGEWNYMGIQDSILIVGRPPLFTLLLGALYRIFPDTITTLRSLTAMTGVFTTGLLMAGVWKWLKPGDQWLGLLAGFLYATLPFAVLYNRMGFSYNLLAPILLINYFCLLRYLDDRNSRWVIIVGILSGIGFLIDLWMLVTFPVVVATILFVNRRHIPIAIFSLILLPSAYIAAMLAASPDAFLFDLRFTIERVRFSFTDQAAMLISNYAFLLIQHSWFGYSLLGFLFIRDHTQRFFTISFLGATLILASRSVLLYGLGSYQFLPLVPLLTIGLAYLMMKVFQLLKNQLRLLLALSRPDAEISSSFISTTTFLMMVLLAGVPWGVNMISGFDLQNIFFDNVYATLIDAYDANEVADFVNSRVGRDEVVLASPAIAWMLDANAADFQVSLAYGGYETHHLPVNIPQSRFSFDPSVDNARFVVTDSIWDNWAASSVADYSVLMEEISGWDFVYEVGEFRVYENPDH